MQQSQQTH